MGGGAKKVGLEVDLGTGEAKRGLQELDAQIKSLEKQQEKAGSVWARWGVDLKKGLVETRRDVVKEIGSLPTSLARGIVSEVAKNAAALGDAVTAPARTTYAQAIDSSKAWRRETQTASIAIGRDYRMVREQAMQVAKITGEMPETTLGWSRSIRQMGTSWNDAVGGVEVFTDRALQTDRTLSQLLPVAETLTDSFDIRKSSDVSQFFNTLDNNAKRAGMSVEQMERSVMALSGAFGTLGKSNLSSVSAVFGALSQKAASPEQARNAMGALASMPSQYLYGFEKRARAMGLLKKGEYATDERGQARPELLLDFAEVMQKKLPGHLHARDRMDLIAKMGRTMFGPGLEGRQIASSLLSLDVPGLRNQSRESALQAFFQQRGQSLRAFQRTETYGRSRSEIEKTEKDRSLGDGLLGVQDMATRWGGGGNGLLLNNKLASFAGAGAAMVAEASNAARSAMGRPAQTDAELAESLLYAAGYSSTESRSQNLSAETESPQPSLREVLTEASGGLRAVVPPEAATAFGRAVAQELNKSSGAPGLGNLPTQSSLER